MYPNVYTLALEYSLFRPKYILLENMDPRAWFVGRERQALWVFGRPWSSRLWAARPPVFQPVQAGGGVWRCCERLARGLFGGL